MKILPRPLQLEFERVNFVYDHLATGLIMSLLVGAALLVVMYDVPGVEKANWWYGSLLTVVAIRFAILYLYRRSINKITYFKQWRTAFIVGACAMGLVWGLGGLVLFPAEDVGRQIFLCFIIGGMVMGAVPYLSPLLPAYWLFLFSSELPINIYLLTFSDQLHVALGMVNILFTITMLVASRLNQKNFTNTYNLRYANEELVNRLNEINNELEHKIYLKNKVEQDLRENEHKFKALADAAHDGVLIHNNGIVIEANEALANMAGYSMKELIGKSVLDFVAPEYRDDVVRRLSELKDETLESTGLRKDGSTFRAEVYRGGIHYQGTDMRIISIRDISKQKQIEADLLHAKNAAEEADKLKSEFLASVSHELRTPLNAIAGSLQLLDESKLDKQQHNYTEMGGRAAKQLLLLIDDLLDLSRIETGHLELRYQDANLNALLYEVIQMLSLKARERNDEITLSISDSLPEYAHIEPDRLKQILINLLGNAIKFTENGQITLNVALQETGKEVGSLYFEVIDNGIGISEDKQATIFNRFTQMDSSISRNYGGAGLGLTICKELVERMGGAIGVDSSPGKGARFWFSLPFKQVSSPPLGNSETKEAELDSRLLAGKSVLLVDDEETNQIIARSILEKLGCVVDVLVNGQQAVETDKQYDLIVMDVQMPVLDGLEATRQLRQKGISTPIIALTANAMQEDQQRCLEVGMDDYLCKPIDMKQLQQTLVRWLPENKKTATRSGG